MDKDVRAKGWQWFTQCDHFACGWCERSFYARSTSPPWGCWLHRETLTVRCAKCFQKKL